MDENEPLINRSGDKTIIIYTRRWWVLAIFSLNCFMQAIIWNTWGPIAQSAKEVFGWDDGQLGMLPNWGNIGFIATVIFASYIMDEKGLRISCVVCSGLISAGAALRCITSIPKYATWLINTSAILNGIAGTVFFAGPALIASVWFPLDQRATATAIGSFFNYAGVAVGFVIGPQLVSAPKYNHSSATGPSQSNDLTTDISVTTASYDNHTTLLNYSQLQTETMWLMYYECMAAGALFIAGLIYFPNKPPTPPSYTASVKRIEYTNALGKIIRNGPVWLISLAYALPAGVYGVWGSVLDVILNPVGVSQANVGWIGFFATMAGCFGSLVIARFADLFMKHMKLFLVCLYICGGGSYVWFTLICTKIIPYSLVQIYISCIIGCIFLNGGIPLFYELSCEVSYPIAEGITGAFLTLLNNSFGVMFLLALQIPNIGTSWMNWTLLGSIAVGLLFMFAFPESYGRTDLDMEIDIPAPTEEEKSIVFIPNGSNKIIVNDDILTTTHDIAAT
ncbi:MFS transporter, FLVCR family, disrupted in renal carcinoma protein 2 [Mytilus galloprovincialis]|uniref:MFS transporter, FLVCR family, disrupted in renal carcinoma protein 2 n=1 Tax=Mytilus galloprovincialis TaxID=29158 RepID=A0A8B6FXR4_MYTGA|nr:MFS transporter, FLVCR family, disrupted in renal carcinoma protein 2 [Mytilus galloprovincialis]